MEINGVGSAVARGTRLRVSSLLIAFAMLAGSLLLIQQRAEAAPASGPVAAAVAATGLDAPAQIDVGALIRSIVCPILLAVRNAFASGPFGGFVTPILNNLLAAFGCTASG